MKFWEAMREIEAGAKVQYKLGACERWWDLDKDCVFSLCDLQSALFRFKPEPGRELVVWVNEYNTSAGTVYFFYLSEDLADKATTFEGYVRTVRMREWPEGEE